MIPATAHFIWFGPRFDWLYGVALLSAAERGGFERVVVHCEQSLEGTAGHTLAAGDARIEWRPLVAPDIFSRLGARGDALHALFQQLEAPAARANMVRAAILGGEGGVYLDTDVITMRHMDDLRSRYGAFCGVEHVVFPATTVRSRSLLTRAGALVKTFRRDLYRRRDGGWRDIRRHEHTFAAAANNAVLASEPGHPFIESLIDGMLAVPPERQLKRFALGTHLLQDVVHRYDGDGLGVLAPPVFYPLGPEISQHWFREGTAAHVDELVLPETRGVHWYASVRTREIVPLVDADWVRANEDSVALAALCAPWT
ncbi:MAG: hypothetical protein ACI81R_000387 [Bradymonadia bacterium]|jgi:hypothetical protein